MPLFQLGVGIIHQSPIGVYGEMRRSHAQLIFIVIFWISSLGVAAHAQSAFDEKKLNSQIDVLLKTRDLTEVSNELSRANSPSIRELLKSIIIFARAGHRERVAKAVRRLGSMPVPERHEDRFYINKIVSGAIDRQDLASLRIFHELFQPAGGDRS